ncbi:MAG: putative O-glycosylation ligase, exosortase A system-associated [Candidatus Rokubacteria bacterium]|nr:putative O-glycosylation ligase, exosortase A system-associated [Candidatus Rokubacteria bacterium]
MPIRDLVLTTIIVGLLPFCLARPWIGILAWSWIGFMNPHRLTWSFAYSMPFAQMVAIATTVGVVFMKDRPRMPFSRELWFLGLLWATFAYTTIFAYYPQAAWDQLIKVSKIFLFTFLTVYLMQDAGKVRWLLWVIAISFGFYGFKGGIFAIMTGGRFHVLGPPGSFFGGNTEVGLVLTMTLPILIYLRRTESERWVRHGLLAVFFLSIVAILITYSRGALLGLAIVLAVLFLRARSKVVAIILVGIGLPLAMSSLPDQWFGRMETIQTYERDRSAMGRIEAWRVATEIANDHPFVGGGFRTFTTQIFRLYGFEQGRDAHSIYFQILGEHGYLGLALFLLLIGSTLLSLRRLARRTFDDDPAKRWIPECAQMIEASILAYLIAGAFLSMSYFDYFYTLVAITVLLKVLAARPAPVVEPTPAPIQVRAPQAALARRGL